ncbi:hypothetical protein L2E82_19974 [Cichorium intybus]|uniref:Uncharacterized protein n=1 Tax=Cichorium intybus TaxID=13427 RepID=A0ACB9DRN9_CICIN|nr:hypothetical protein L2E82_19974 [Cichorium intybus]
MVCPRVRPILHTPGDIVKVGQTLLRLVVDESSVPFDASDASESVDHKFDHQTTQRNENLSTPAVRSLAKQHGIDLDDVIGSGKHGRILKDDVLKYAVEKGIIDDKPASFNPTSIEPMTGPEEQLQEMADSLYQDKIFSLRVYQRAMVKSMTAASNIPHFHYVEEINCDNLIELKAAFKKENTDPDLKFTFLPVLIIYLSMALTTHPLVNSTFNLENYEVTLKGHHNIGIPMVTPCGLVVPNIKNVQSLSILELKLFKDKCVLILHENNIFQYAKLPFSYKLPGENDVRRGSKDIIGEVRSPQQPIGLRGRSGRSTLLSSSSKVFLVVVGELLNAIWVLIGLLCKDNQKEEVERTSISEKSCRSFTTASLQAAQPPPPTQSVGVPSSGPNSNPLDLFPQGLPDMGTNAHAGGAAGNLDFLLNSPQFQALRVMVQANPQILQRMLQELGKQNSHLVRLIQEHQADFLRLINEPVEGGENILGDLPAAMP